MPAMKRILLLAVVWILGFCQPRTTDPHIAAAKTWTDRYSRSPLGQWDVRAHAAGSDCRVLLVELSTFMRDAAIEAMHYGTGPYAIQRGGVQRFCRERSFRGVAYKDAAGRIWIYGTVNAAERASLERCH
jgi:hypothetical protein